MTTGTKLSTREHRVMNVGGVWHEPVHWAVLSNASGFEIGILRLELIADDHSYVYKTTDQKYNTECRLPYGPVINRYKYDK